MNMKGAYLGTGIFSFLLMVLTLNKTLLGLILGIAGIFSFFMAFKEDK